MKKRELFKTLYHEGPQFPKPYEPKGYTLNGKALSPLAEEMIWKGARFIDSDYATEAYASKSNMWACLFPELDKSQRNIAAIMTLMQEMKLAQEHLKEEKKALPKEEKLAIKAEKDAYKAQFGTAILDGQSVSLSNFMIEEPNWIMTRGKDPRKFCWKYAVDPKSVRVNIVGHQPPATYAKQVTPETTAKWTSKYKIQCGRPEMKCATVITKVQSFALDCHIIQNNITGKFEKAKDILSNWSHIQNEITKGCLNGDPEAFIIYLIQQTGIRIGNERDGDKQALTYGMQTLEKQHLELTAPNLVHFDFLGKDSVPDQRTIEIDPTVWVELNKLVDSVKKGLIFGTKLNVNGYLKNIMPGISVKNLRTVVCNLTLINNLRTKNITSGNTEAEKLRALFEANLEIAKTLNHQKNVGKNQKEGEAKIAERVKKAKARVKDLKVKHKEKVAKLNDKAAKFRVTLKGTKMLKEKLAEVDAQKAKLEAQMERALLTIEKTEFSLDKKKLTADVNLGTSLAAYADHKIIKSYCDEVNLPIEKIYSASQMKHVAGMIQNTPVDYWRQYPNI